MVLSSVRFVFEQEASSLEALCVLQRRGLPSQGWLNAFISVLTQALNMERRGVTQESLGVAAFDVRDGCFVYEEHLDGF